MGEVYRNAFLNIGATGAVDSQEGCFRERDYREVFRSIIHKEECLAHLGEGSQSYRLVEQDFMRDCLLTQPLLKRGWVYQERLLAPRMLHYGSQQLFWECRDMSVCESYPTHVMAPLELTTLSSLQKGLEGDEDEAMRRVRGLYHWYSIVEQYTSMALTRPEDKLIAISGVAQQYNKTLLDDDKYWVGTWQSDLPGGLCWRVKGGKGTRPKTFRAPTWSWASIDGTILGPSQLQETTGRFLVSLRQPMIHYVDESNPYGPVTSAELEVQTRLVTVQALAQSPNDDHDDDGDGDGVSYVLSIDGVEIPNSHWYPDETVESDETDVTCVCFSTGKHGLWGVTVKLLTQDSNSETSDDSKQHDAEDGKEDALDMAGLSIENEGEEKAPGNKEEDDDGAVVIYPYQMYVRTGAFYIAAADLDDEEWCCPVGPFAELFAVDLDQEEPFFLV
ncbi:hypothetical protein OQA88_11007 [Cercophora sp. LCS_1]